ncbi:hypothetical protein BSKO_08676 [Bryopsis sp. KO-2023]|nr:hypothetical protein BSKO_08676 [Bryopsis sp. KO-2023]
MGRSTRSLILKQMLANQEEHNRLERPRTNLNQPPKRRTPQKRHSLPDQTHDEPRRRGGSPIVFRSQPRSEPRWESPRESHREYREESRREYQRKYQRESRRESRRESEREYQKESSSALRTDPLAESPKPRWMTIQDEPTSSGERKRQRTSSTEGLGTLARGPTCARSHPFFDPTKVQGAEVVDLLEEDMQAEDAPRSEKNSNEHPASPNLVDPPADDVFLPRIRPESDTPQVSNDDKPGPSRKIDGEANEQPAFTGLKGDGILVQPWVDDGEENLSGGGGSGAVSPVVPKKSKIDDDEPWCSKAAEKTFSTPPTHTYALRGRTLLRNVAPTSPERPESLGIGRFLFSLTSEQREVIEGLQVEFPQRTPGAVLLRFCDLKRLEPSEFLNDNIIEFYIKHLVRELEGDEHYRKQLYRCHFFNSYLFEKVNRDSYRGPEDKCPGYTSVKTWTKNVDLFEKDFLFFPIHETVHWSLVVVCHPRAAFTKLDEEEAKKKSPCLLHLDSMGAEGHNTEYVCGRIRKYLECEWEEKRNSPALVHRESVFDVKRMDVPLQGASVDCGLFILAYIEYFVHALPSAIHIDTVDKLKDVHRFKYFLSPQWFPRKEAFHLRVHLRKLIITLMFCQYEDENVKILVGKLMNMCDSHTYAGPKAVETRNSIMFAKARRKALDAEKKKKKSSKKSTKSTKKEEKKQNSVMTLIRSFLGPQPCTVPNSDEDIASPQKTNAASNSHNHDMAKIDLEEQRGPPHLVGHDMGCSGGGNEPGPSSAGEFERGNTCSSRQNNDKEASEELIDLVVEDEEDDMEVVCGQQQEEDGSRWHSRIDSDSREASPML